MKTKLSVVQRVYFEAKFLELRYHASYPVTSLSEVDLYWNDTYNSRNGILGSFQWFRPDEICLSPVGQQTPELLMGVLFHELRHRYQFKTLGLLYFLQLIPGIRVLTLEPSAYAVEHDIDTAVSGMDVLGV